MADFSELLSWAKRVLGLGTGPYKGYKAFRMFRIWKKLKRVEVLVKELRDEAAYSRSRQEFIKVAGQINEVLQALNTSSRPSGRSITRAPGWTLHRLAALVYSPTTFELVFAQTLRDLQDEHVEALNDGDRWKARWVVLRGYGSFWGAVITLVPVLLAKKLHAFWKIIP